MATTTHLAPDRDLIFGTASASARVRNLARARRHTRLVRILRRLLPVTALLVIVGYVTVVLRTVGWVEGLPQIEISNIIPENLTMHNPRYEGFNEDGGTYVVTAKTAVQDLTDLGRVTLNDIVGDLEDANKKKTNLKAKHGFYNSKNDELELYDGIDIVAESGMRARLSRAHVRTKENVIVSDEPVVVEIPGGTIRSNALTLHNKTRNVLFRDSVTAHLVPSQQPQAAAKPAKSAAAGAPLISPTNGPIDITSSELKIDDAKKTAAFSGDVRATQGDAVLETSTLEVQYEGQGEGAALADAAGSKIRAIASPAPVVMTRAPNDRVTGNRLDFDALNEVAVLTGDVVMTSGTDRRAMANTVTIDQKADTLLLVGDVVVVQGRNQLGGGRLFVERATGRTQLTNPMPGAKPGRISTRFYGNVGDGKTSGTPVAGAEAAVFKTDPNAPIDIEADRLNVDDQKKLAIFNGDVHAAQGDFKVRTSTLKAHYTGEAGLAGEANNTKQAAQLTRIEAVGKVIVTSENGQSATGDWANFDMKANQVTLGGDVVLSQGKNVVRGTRLVIDMATGKSTIHNDPGAAWSAKAAPEDEKKDGYVVQGPLSGGRPSAVFYPNQKNAAPKKKPAPQPSGSADGWSTTGDAP